MKILILSFCLLFNFSLLAAVKKPLIKRTPLEMLTQVKESYLKRRQQLDKMLADIDKKIEIEKSRNTPLTK